MDAFGLRLLPAGLLLLGATVVVLAPALRESAAALVPAYPYTVFVVGALLGWRFRRGRVVLALLVLALADRALAHWAAGEAAATPSGRALLDAVALLLPLDLAAIAWMPERSALSRHGRLAAGVLGAQALAVALVTHPQAAPLAGALQHAFVPPRFLGWTALAQPALIAFVVALAATAVRFALRPRPLESGVLGALVAAFVALSVPGLGLPSTIYLATGGLILAVSLVEASHAMAFGDELTGLPARRALNEALGEIGGQYAVAMVDVDHFKKFNDDHGHDVGDDLLRMVGARLGRVTGGGRAFRYGGEEFAVIFPGLSTADARPHAEALRQSIEGAEFTVRGPGRPRKRPGAAAPRTAARARNTVGVTVSVGLADAGRRGATPAGVTKAADQALYRAKRAGRNRVSV